MDDLIKILEKIGITANILVGLLAVWLLFSLYKNYLETKKIKLEIVMLLKKINSPNKI